MGTDLTALAVAFAGDGRADIRVRKDWVAQRGQLWLYLGEPTGAGGSWLLAADGVGGMRVCDMYQGVGADGTVAADGVCDCEHDSCPHAAVLRACAQALA